MLKYVSKFAMDILPSVVATIIGAYIVNHYIVTKPGTDAPAAAAAVSSGDPKSAVSSVDPRKKPDIKTGTAPEAVPTWPISPSRVSGRRASPKGPSSRDRLPKSRRSSKSRRSPKSRQRNPPTSRPRPRAFRWKRGDRSRRRAKRPSPRRCAVRAAVGVGCRAGRRRTQYCRPSGPVEAAAVPEERRDANDLARAAIERLRGTTEGPPRAQEAARAPKSPRVASAPRCRAVGSAAAAADHGLDARGRDLRQPGHRSERAPYAPTGRTDDPHRPTPPADIPDSRPLDLRAEAVDASPPPREHTTVAEDVLSAAKSVFHAVLPK